LWPDVPGEPPKLSGTRLLQAEARAFKVYRDVPKIGLSSEFPVGGASFSDVIRQRRSRRDFTGEPLDEEQLSALLALSVGVTAIYRNPVAVGVKRAFPSAGAMYPVEFYPLVLDLDGVDPGVYHYDVRQHALELLRAGAFRDAIFEYCMRQEFIRHASLVLALTAIFRRSKDKYGERGYRFALLDAGHAAQNMYLVATALEIGAVAIGGFLDDRFNDLLEVDGVAEAVVYLLAFGALPPHPEDV
jgi:SagB-type dehydrogenase family enzyme